MNDQYDSWRKSPHHGVAVCNDCHVPPHFPQKYIAKALNGYHHSTGFTMQPPRPDDPGNTEFFSRTDHDQAGQQPDPPGQLPPLPWRFCP